MPIKAKQKVLCGQQDANVQIPSAVVGIDIEAGVKSYQNMCEMEPVREIRFSKENICLSYCAKTAKKRS